MNNFIKALDTALKTENWYGVLFISLTLPDICGKVDEPKCTSSQRRTNNWFNKYLKPKYTHNLGPDGKMEHVFLSGNDFYALRCALLHEGSGDITSQRAREVLDEFAFVMPGVRGNSRHMIQDNQTLQLQVDNFGNEMLDALQQWLNDIKNDAVKMAKVNNFLDIKILD
ncbi:hypothetical protein BS639_18530 [Rouxiella silvae]|uniref:Uncharacterized protein n=1 Tax=Rouxiella silvae TaxID=1646373 RepID=A0ABX3TX16_9GAMM|nr:hypothetical protein [Rouxiella silvae]ORJ19743.1 hypothetical protein BS639_18530 [Rouxiella silvae]